MKLIKFSKILYFFIILNCLIKTNQIFANPILAHSELKKCGNFNVIGHLEIDAVNSRKIFIIYAGSFKETEFLLEGKVSIDALSSKDSLVKINVDFINNKTPKFIYRKYVDVAGKTESYENAIELIKESPCEP